MTLIGAPSTSLVSADSPLRSIALSQQLPNFALEPTANSLRSASAIGGGSPRAFGEQ
jgi:hypothetical protein